MTERHAIQVNGTPLRVAVARADGTVKPPLVFLHGLGSSATTGLRHIAEHSALATYPHVLIDMPGFGESLAPATWGSTIEDQATVAAAIMDRLRLAGAVVVGHSMGGSVAILLASQRPDLVTRLIVAEPLLDPAQGTLSAHIARQSEPDFVARGYPALQRATRRQAARGDVAAAGFLRTLAQADPAMMHRSAVSLLAQRTPSFQERLCALTIPRTFIAGARSGIETALLHKTGIHVIVVTNAGHSMMDEAPGEFARAIASAIVRE